MPERRIPDGVKFAEFEVPRGEDAVVRQGKDPENRTTAIAQEAEPRLLVAQLQAAVNRISMRDSGAIDPLSAAFYLHEKHVDLETGIDDGDLASAESALTDLYITSMWIADGYGVILRKAYQEIGHSVLLDEVSAERLRLGSGRSLADELRAARLHLAELMRNIGLYETDYGVRESSYLPPLKVVVPEFHVSLLGIGAKLGVKLFARLATAFQLGMVTSVSSRRPNPLYAKSVRRFEPIARRTYCPFATTAALWGASEYDLTVSTAENVRRSIEPLLRFSRAARRETLDGFVYAFPVEHFGNTAAELSALLRVVIGTLMEHDPRNPRTFNRDDVVRADWRFSFNGEDYFVPVFAPVYGQGHSRYTYEVSDTVFILLQPDSSFHSRLGADGGRIRKQIRQRFREGLQPYDTSNDIEAHRFLLPIEDGSPAPAWYDARAV